MSQSSNSASNMNIFSELSTITLDNKINSPTVGRVVKRAASGELEGEVKKVMVDHQSYQKQAASVVPKSFDQPKFINASMVTSIRRANVQLMPELSDEELLAYAIDFEKKNP